MAGDSSSETDAASMGSGCRETPPVASMTGGETGRQDVRRPGLRLPPVTVTRPPPAKPPTVSVASRIRGLTERYNLKQSRETASKRNVSRERAAEEAAVSLGQRRVSVQFGEREFVGYFLPHDTLQVTPHDAATACPRVISPVPGIRLLLLDYSDPNTPRFLLSLVAQAVYEWLGVAVAAAGTEELPHRFSLGHAGRLFPLRPDTRDTPLTHVPLRLSVHADTDGNVSLGLGREPLLLSPRQARFELPVDLRELEVEKQAGARASRAGLARATGLAAAQPCGGKPDRVPVLAGGATDRVSGMSARAYARRRCRCAPEWTELFVASFRSADRDGDGFLTLPEAEEAARLLCSPRSPLLAHLVSLLGLRDEDQGVDLPLFIAMCVILGRRGRGGVRSQNPERSPPGGDEPGRRECGSEEEQLEDKERRAASAGGQQRGRRGLPHAGQGCDGEEQERLLECADFHGLQRKLSGLRVREDLRQLLLELQESGSG
ncbi:unnamed protein product [Lampetra planeri]